MTAVAQALQSLSLPPPVSASSLAGGCIHDVRLVRLEDKTSVVCKVACGDDGRSQLLCEDAGLARLAHTHTVRVPCVHGLVHRSHETILVMEYLPPGVDGNWTQAGQQLGQMHLANVGKRYGVADDFWIGGTRFQGGWSDDWCEWLSEHCLKPLVRSCRDQRVLYANECTSIGRVIDALPNIVPSNPTPSLLHGDLWQGNLYVMQCGTVAFIDPASWVGDPMVDLAMVSLFGSLPAGFVQAWRASGIDHTSVRERIAVGQLLHLLNHARLFGRSYVPGVLERVDQLT